MTNKEAIEILEDEMYMIWETASEKDFAMKRNEAFDMAIEALKVDLVRCRECKHWRPHSQYGYDYDYDEFYDYCRLLVPEDEYYAFRRDADDFCSYGERRSDE